ncbi:MAG: hypothetical protein RL238_2348 [Actinomycetota bacterium]|jgi:hypothetical protein
MSGFDDHPLPESEARRHGPSGGAIVGTVALWVIGLPTLLFVASMFALGAGFAADSGQESNPAGAFMIVALVGVVIMVCITVLLLGGGADEEPMEPPAPYAGRPLTEVPPVASSFPAKRRSGPSPDDA